MFGRRYSDWNRSPCRIMLSGITWLIFMRSMTGCRIRRADPERKEELRQDKAEITAQITELRKRRKMAINIEERSTHIDTMMTHLYENEMEAKTKTQTRTERSYSR